VVVADAPAAVVVDVLAAAVVVATVLAAGVASLAGSAGKHRSLTFAAQKAPRGSDPSRER
jgi:phosphosulfolactate phosphohydrolase-like enzyme